MNKVGCLLCIRRKLAWITTGSHRSISCSVISLIPGKYLVPAGIHSCQFHSIIYCFGATDRKQGPRQTPWCNRCYFLSQLTTNFCNTTWRHITHLLHLLHHSFCHPLIAMTDI